MSDSMQATCRIVRSGQAACDGRQGFSYFEGIARQTVGSKGICMHLLTIPPGARSKAHMHEGHETALYALSGETHCWYGERLDHRCIVREGEMLYIPAGVPHLPANLSDRPATAVVARTDPNEQESVVLLPQLEALVDLPGATGSHAVAAASRRQALLAHLGHAVIRMWSARTWSARTWNDRGRQRRALGELDDRLLSDVGLTRAEARHECAKPFWRR